MATAVQANVAPPAANPNRRLLMASFLGALFLLAGLVLAGYGVPRLLSELLPASLGNSFLLIFARFVAQVAIVIGLVWLGTKLAGANPPKGLRGGIFLFVSVLVTWFFIVRAVGLNFDGTSIAPVFTGVAGVGLAYLGYWFLTSPRGIRYMHMLEEQGWFHTKSYKPSQGRRMRQYTIIGLLLIGLSGVWSLISNGTIGTGNLVANMPLEIPSFVALSDKQYAVPLLLAATVIWLAWRTVNVPQFADFLVATEAEMNKVSWSSRRRLIQDTIVVLVTTAFLTYFLLAIDLFWGWLLADVVQVLPTAKPGQQSTSANLQSESW